MSFNCCDRFSDENSHGGENQARLLFLLKHKRPGFSFGSEQQAMRFNVHNLKNVRVNRDCHINIVR
jgi:hypothetical protein